MKTLLNKNSKGFTFISRNESAFTLIEALIVIAVVGVVGLILVEILTRGFKGSNKTQLIGTIKQNGQVVLNQIDQTIRNSDAVVCQTPPDFRIITLHQIDGRFIRFRADTAGQTIKQDTLVTSNPNNTNDLCDLALTPVDTTSDVSLSNNSATGVKLENIKFESVSADGGKDAVHVFFEVSPIQQGGGYDTQLDKVQFDTTVQLR